MTRMVGIVVTVAVAVSGCATSTQPPTRTPTVTTSPVEPYLTAPGPGADNPIAKWSQDNGAQFNDVGNAMLATSRALSQRGGPQLALACRHLSEAADDLGAGLPTPDQELTTALEALVDNMKVAAAACPGAGATAAPEGFVTAMRTAQSQYETAQRILSEAMH